MSLDLTAELEHLVESKVKSGSYSSAADVIREALGLLEERDQILLLQKQEIAEKITQGLNSLRRGEAVDGESVFNRIDADHDYFAPPAKSESVYRKAPQQKRRLGQ